MKNHLLLDDSWFSAMTVFWAGEFYTGEKQMLSIIARKISHKSHEYKARIYHTSQNDISLWAKKPK